MSYRVGIDRIEDQTGWKRELKGLIKDIDAEDVLSHYGAQNVRVDHSSRGDQYIHSCLIDRVDPHHSHGDKNPSASMQADNKLYNCYSYSGGDLFWFLEIMEGSREKAYALLKDFVGAVSYDKRDVLADLEKLLVVEQRTTEIPSYSMNVLKAWEYHHPYVSDVRGISDEVAQNHLVGYDPESVTITLPHIWDGNLVGWQKRRLDDDRWPKTPRDENGKLQPKYKNTSNFPKNETLYLGDGGSRPGILLVESIMSVLKLETDKSQYLDVLPKTIGSTFGAKIGEEQVDWVAKHCDGHIYLWYDSDLPGRQATKKLIDELGDHGLVSLIPVLPGEGDPADLEPEVVREKLRSPELAMLGYGDLVKEIARLRRERKDQVASSRKTL